jgi:Uma2 family endonuclease
VRAYEATGLPELWLVDTIAETVLGYRRSDPAVASFGLSLEFGPSDIITSPQLRGFELPVPVIFES